MTLIKLFEDKTVQFNCFAAEKPATMLVSSLKFELLPQVMGDDECQRQLTHPRTILVAVLMCFQWAFKPVLGKQKRPSALLVFMAVLK